MFFNKRTKRKTDDMIDKIEAILPMGATLVSFDYYKKVFGNIVVVIEVGNAKHTFITDRGEI